MPAAPAPAPAPPVRAATAAIVAQDLCKVYGARKGKRGAVEALKGISLEVPRGGIFGLLGPNGAGKSTFINILAGLTVKTSGRVAVWGFDLDVNPRHVRVSIGVVPQELSLDTFFTPAEILELQAGLYGCPPRARRTMDILRALALDDKAHAYARTLSGGMRRRLLMAKAMVHAPPVLVLDEPTAGVDVALREQLWEHVRALNADGVTVVLTTHYLEEAQALCDRIAIIDHGEVVACEDTPDLLARVDHKSLTITPREPLAALPDGLARFDARLDADGRIIVSYAPRRVAAGEILAALTDAGVGVREISTHEADLHDVFIRLTSHDSAASA